MAVRVADHSVSGFVGMEILAVINDHLRWKYSHICEIFISHKSRNFVLRMRITVIVHLSFDCFWHVKHET